VSAQIGGFLAGVAIGFLVGQRSGSDRITSLMANLAHLRARLEKAEADAEELETALCEMLSRQADFELSQGD